MTELFGSMEVALEFAIAREQESYELYARLAGTAPDPVMREVLRGFAAEEQGHKRTLEEIRRGARGFAPARPVLDLRIADYTVELEPRPDLDLSYQEVLLVAMQKEKAAFRLNFSESF